MRLKTSVATAVLAAALGLASGNAFAANEVQKECSTKYQAAKAANQLGGKNWNQFYKECAAEAKAEPAAAPATPEPTPAPAKETKAPKEAKAAKKPPAAAPAAGGGAVYPKAVSTEFSKETPGKARFKTCLAQYNANKTSNANGGLKWIEKGGGYYSECNKRLKG